jgi:SSS family solute:Na+ symporter
MNLSGIDWAIVIGMVTFIGIIGFITKSLTKSVSDFLAANRCAGRYLMSVSQGMAGLGAISIVAIYEKFYNAGFPAQWWTWMVAPLGLILGLSGWVLYRYRETKVLTMSELFERRYSRKFRIFTGILAWISGVLNYGIFPGVTARFMITFCGFPKDLQITDSLSIPTLLPMMFVMLSIALFLTFSGGQIAVMITDFFQGQIVIITFTAMVIILLYRFGWDNIVTTLKLAPAGESMLNPFGQDVGKIKGFDITFFLIMAFIRIYNCRAWQGSQGYNCAAKSAHEARMSAIIGEWRNQVTLLSSMLVPICAWVMMKSVLYADKAAQVTKTLSAYDNPQLREQMLVPTALTHMLPVGMMGLFAVCIIAAAVSTDDTYLHSWGSIFIQDVVMPFRKKPFSSRAHMWLLRLSIIFVAVFAFFWSWLFPIGDYIYMYFNLTGAIYLGGVGSVIIGGLYTRWGTTAGAWAGMITGCILATSGAIIKNLWVYFPYLTENIGPKCPFNGMHLTLIAGLCAIVAYVVTSLLTCKEPFNLEKLLHRNEKKKGEKKQKKTFSQLIGITDEFTKFDKFIYYFKIAWSVFWVLAFVVGTTWGILGMKGILPATTDDGWANWWLFMIIISMTVGTLSVIWFLWGGFYDLVDLVKTLRSSQRNEADSGWVEEEAQERIEEVIEEEMQLPEEVITSETKEK